jgi:hypothetical protein
MIIAWSFTPSTAGTEKDDPYVGRQLKSGAWIKIPLSGDGGGEQKYLTFYGEGFKVITRAMNAGTPDAALTIDLLLAQVIHDVVAASDLAEAEWA